VPFQATASERDRIVRTFQQTLAETGMRVPMATTNLFTHPVFKDGRVHEQRSAGARVRVAEDDALDRLGAELGAQVYVFWGGREGTETDACRDPRIAWQRACATR
jgi:xylose isomerase